MMKTPCTALFNNVWFFGKKIDLSFLLETFSQQSSLYSAASHLQNTSNRRNNIPVETRRFMSDYKKVIDPKEKKIQT